MKNIEIVRAYWDAEERKDFARVLDYYCEDSVLRSPQAVCTGKAQIESFYRNM